MGNTAVAYTGPTDTTDYNLLSPSGNGTAAVSGVTQQASFGLNNVFGSSTSTTAGTGAVSLVLSNTADPGAGFTQTVVGSTEALAGPTGDFGNVFPNVINGIAANVGTGSASITGSTTALTQSFLNQQNSISTGGSLSGTATQNASDFTSLSAGPVPSVGYGNVAFADVGTGPASITNVSQNMTQSLNTVSAGAASSGLTLNQNADLINLGSNNAQVASGSSSATISGAQQFASTSVNVAQLGSMSGYGHADGNHRHPDQHEHPDRTAPASTLRSAASRRPPARST